MISLKHSFAYLGMDQKFAQIILALSVAACSNFTKIPKDTLVIGIENEIKNLDVRFASDANSGNFARLVFQGLVDYDSNLKIVGDLASEIREIIPGQAWEFKIPKNRKFHDGTPLTSADVLYSFEQAASATSRIKSLFFDLSKFETPDPYTFRIFLKKVRPAFYSSDLPVIKIFPKHLAVQTEAFAKDPVGSGPFRFLKKVGRDIKLEKWDNYFLLEKTSFYKNVILRTLEDPTTRFLSLVGEDVDLLANALGPQKIKEALRHSQLRVNSSPGSTLQYLGMNMRHPVLKIPKVREALSVAIDRKSITEIKLKGMAQPATSILPPGNPYFVDSLPQIRFDPELARKLLKEAGLEKGFEIRIRSSSDKDTLSNLQLIAQSWRDIGVKVLIHSTEFASFFADVQKGDFEVFSLRLTALMDPDILSKLFHSREFPPGRNRTFYLNPEVDQLLDLAASETQFDLRKDKYSAIQALIYNDRPFIPLWYPSNIVVANSKVSDLKIHPLGSWLPFLFSKKD